MTRQDYITEVAERANLPKKVIKAALEAMQATVVDHITEEEIPVLDGLRVTVSTRAARTGRNPQTGEAMEIPAKVVPKAKFGKALKVAVE